MDAGQVQGRKERDIGKNYETKVEISRKEGVIKPLAKRVIASAGGRREQERGNGRVGSGGEKKGTGRTVRIRQGR